MNQTLTRRHIHQVIVGTVLLVGVALVSFPAALLANDDEYDTSDIASVVEVELEVTADYESNNPRQYIIRLENGTQHLVSRTSDIPRAFQEALEDSGYTGDVDALLSMVDSTGASGPEAALLALQARVAALQAELEAVRESDLPAGDASWCNTEWSRSLTIGDRGSDVRVLQRFLNAVPGIQVAQSGDGAPGFETTYFGPQTAAALAQFQERHADEILMPLGLSQGTGYFGPLTQTWVDRYCDPDAPENAPDTIRLDRLNEPTGDSTCSSEGQTFTEGTRTNGFRSPTTGLFVSIQNGYFVCADGQWEPQEFDQ